nr:hypothetical protein [Tanacetum cinerariifolium]
EQGPLIWPSMEVKGVTRLKKYSELSAAETIQADCDVKATNIILTPYQHHQPLYQQSQFEPQATSYHNSQFVSPGPSSLTHSFSYPVTNTSSLVNHNAYMASSSAPQIAYAPMVQQSLEYSPPEAGLDKEEHQENKGSLRVTTAKAKAQANGHVLQEEELEFLADPDCDEINSAKIDLMANFSHYG